MSSLDSSTASRLAQIALGHVQREYPHSETVRSHGPEDSAGTPCSDHPIFFGSYDWHSCVHGHWLLARLLRRFPGLPEAAAITALFESSYTAEKVLRELAFFDRPGRAGFERPYGWCWFFKLFSELDQLEAQHLGRWTSALQPFADRLSELLKLYLPRLLYPIRSGAHNNTAFALLLAGDFAFRFDPGLHEQISEQASRYFLPDRDYQGWEPGGEDFLSPGWQEALLMQQVLGDAFPAWFDAFLPHLADGSPAQLLHPVQVSDRSDGRLAHLDGLNLSRAWCMREVAEGLPADHRTRAILVTAAESHLQAGAGHLQDDYMGEHWLATFLVLALDGR
ncbi:DUF2891 domain-containing protein [Halopseudomonas nanhaiensis]|uniref:DUF2891 domain-containing protein n=1 Tax=Halopseudomonas nanhaiensis TaxID=2830842 RepID=UPI001CBC955D|nr:DUF2891 domain-containing protein [Halopseudomonas nanhaiensis]UAW98904.1 DUF2891 domain-containing protein [Halopseudomonas nanhaiensis]